MPYLKYFSEFAVDATNSDFQINAVAKVVPNATSYYLDAVTAGESLRRQFELKGQETVATFAVAIDSNTGLVTLSATPTFSITWTDVALRNLLGFTADLASANSYVGTYAAQQLWLPSSPGREEYSAPLVERDVAFGRARSGRVFGLRGSSKRERRFWHHRFLSLATAYAPASPSTAWGWVDPATAGAQRGLWDQLCSGAKVRVYPDRTGGLSSYEATYQLDGEFFRKADLTAEPKMARQFPNLDAYWDAPVAVWRATDAAGNPL